MEEDIKIVEEINGYIVNIRALIDLEKRAVEDLKNNTHNIGQEEVLTIIREFIRLKNTYKEDAAVIDKICTDIALDYGYDKDDVIAKYREKVKNERNKV